MLSSTCDSFGILDFCMGICCFYNSNTTRQVLLSLAERLPYEIFAITSGEQALKQRQIYHTKVLPISAEEFCFSILGTGF